MSIPYNIIELFSKYFLDKTKGQTELFALLPKIKRGNSFRIMWDLYQHFKDNLTELDICKLFQVIGPDLELKYGGNERCCGVIWNLEEDNGLCFPSRCKKDKFTNYNFCKNHYPPISDDSESSNITHRYQIHGTIFDFNIEPCFLKFKRSLYEKNHITPNSKLESYNYYQFNSIQYFNSYSAELSINPIVLPSLIQKKADISNNEREPIILDNTPAKQLLPNKVEQVLPNKVEQVLPNKVEQVLREKVIKNKQSINQNVKTIQVKKVLTFSNKMKQLYITNLLVSAMISKEIKIDKNNIENIKIFDDPTIYLKDKQFIFKGSKPVGIILDCDTAYMIKDIIEELNNHSIDTSMKDVFIDSLK
jgi:hypothetical protein